MGVDIIGYSRVRKLTEAEVKDGRKLSYATYVYKIQDFPERLGSLEGDGWYVGYGEARTCIGYGRYNIWRNWLAMISGWPMHYIDTTSTRSYVKSAWEATSGPFWELICFSDHDGTLGPEACKKLSKDFTEFHGKAIERAERDFLEVYNDMKAIFELAADNGAVIFC
jgi:hypothetical protein